MLLVFFLWSKDTTSVAPHDATQDAAYEVTYGAQDATHPASFVKDAA